MKHILHLKSSLLGNDSHSIKLGDAVVDQILLKYPGCSCDELDLVDMNIPHLTPAVLYPMFAPADSLSGEQKQMIILSDTLVHQLQLADIIVVGAPLINFTIPSQLKS